ncbi:MAG TPA: galactokinase [Bacteroidetes bacterium]|nr:galactokinase [Bacteroidota bacterium]
MPDVQSMLRLIESAKMQTTFAGLYGSETAILREQTRRYETLLQKYREYFSDGDLHLFSTPGRIEIGGNHTDHNAGKVLAAGVNPDSAAGAAATDNRQVTVYSEGYPQPFKVNLDDLEVQEKEKGTTTALIRGIAARLKKLNYRIGGFNAVISGRVLSGSGLSSSASIEVLLGTIFNRLFNENKISAETLALAGQYAENVHFGKPCGLMDQLTCAVGGIVAVDFADTAHPLFERVSFNFAPQHYKVLVIDTGGSHAGLTDEYAAIPDEMKSVAKFFNRDVLRRVEKEEVIANLSPLRKKTGDRALLRSLHFFAENERVDRQVKALRQNNFVEFLELVKESGDSSWKWLQNCYTGKAPHEQGITLALSLTEDFLQTNYILGSCRVHGGGFAGTILVFMPENSVQLYRRFIEKIFGERSVLSLDVRSSGTVSL